MTDIFRYLIWKLDSRSQLVPSSDSIVNVLSISVLYPKKVLKIKSRDKQIDGLIDLINIKYRLVTNKYLHLQIVSAAKQPRWTVMAKLTASIRSVISVLINDLLKSARHGFYKTVNNIGILFQCIPWSRSRSPRLITGCSTIHSHLLFLQRPNASIRNPTFTYKYGRKYWNPNLILRDSYSFCDLNRR